MGASRAPGSTAACRDAHKPRLYAADSDGLPYAFVPLTVETFGGLGPAMDHLSALADFAVSGVPPGAAVTQGPFHPWLPARPGRPFGPRQ
jgi:hypothetical protein